jgi:hypothetical protein
VKIASPLALASAYVQQNSGRPPAAAIDPCLLLAREAAEAGARTALAELRRYSDTTGPACEYSSDSSEVSVTVTALPNGGRTVFDDSSTMYGSSRRELPGVGDRAFIVSGLQVIYVLKGDTLLTLQLINLKMGDAEIATALTTMAKTAASHL